MLHCCTTPSLVQRLPWSLMLQTSSMGTVLQQHQEGDRKPLSFYSWKFCCAKSCYSTFSHELLVPYFVVEFYSYFLTRCQFLLCIAHRILTSVVQTSKTTTFPMKLGTQCSEWCSLPMSVTSQAHSTPWVMSCLEPLSSLSVLSVAHVNFCVLRDSSECSLKFTCFWLP